MCFGTTPPNIPPESVEPVDTEPWAVIDPAQLPPPPLGTVSEPESPTL